MPFNEQQDLEQFFKLRYKGKKRECKSYTKCLKKYLDTSRSINLVTIPDLQNTLGQIQNFLFGKFYHNTNNSHVVESDLQDGEHIVVFWIESNTKTWYLRLLEENDDGIFVAHFVSSHVKTLNLS